MAGPFVPFGTGLEFERQEALRNSLVSEQTASANVNALLGIWANLGQQGAGGVAIQQAPRKTIWYLCADGAIQTITITDECVFVGCGAPSGGELFVTTQMAVPSEPVGGTSGLRPNLIGYSFTPGSTFSLSRTPIPAGTKLYFNVNSGPKLVALVFEPA